METIKAYHTMINIEGLERRALICIDIDQDEPGYMHWDPKEAKSTQQDIDNGKILCLYIQVRVIFTDLGGFEGLDSIGRNFIRASFKREDILDVVNNFGLVGFAISNLTARVLQGQEKLNQFLKGAQNA